MILFPIPVLYPDQMPRLPDAGPKKPAPAPPPPQGDRTGCQPSGAPPEPEKHSAPLSKRLEARATNNHGDVRRWLNGRQVTMGSRAFGLGISGSSDRPQTIGMASHAAVAPRTRGERNEALQAAAVELRQRVDKIMNTTLEQLPDMNHRPGRPAWRDKALQYWPLSMIAATKVGDLIAKDPAYRCANGADREDAPATPADISAQRGDLLGSTARLSAALHAAEREYGAQCAQHPAAADGEHPDVATARRGLEQALTALQATVAIGTRLDYYNNALATDLLEHKVSFVQEQILQCNQKLDAAGLGSGQKLQALSDKRDHLAEEAGLADAGVRGALTELVRVQTLESELLAQCGQLEREREELGEDADPVMLDLDLAGLRLQRDYAGGAVAEANLTLSARQRQKAQADQDQADFMRTFEQKQQEANDSPSGHLRETAKELDTRAQAWQNRAKDAWQAEKDLCRQGLVALAQTAPGFRAAALVGDDGKNLRDALVMVAANLKSDDPNAEREVPALAKLDILGRSVALVCGQDPVRAARLVRELASRPSEQWIALPGAAPSSGAMPDHQEPSEDLKNLFRSMASVQRGTEILSEIGAGGTHPKLGRAPMAALHSYWIADAEIQKSGTTEWLESAQSVARHEVRNLAKDSKTFDTSELPLKQLIAFRGVGRGLLSNGPGSDYERINASLARVGQEWLERVDDTRSTWAKAAFSSVFNADNSRATPFDPKALRVALAQMEAQGIPSVKTHAHDSIAASAAKMSEKLAADWPLLPGPNGNELRKLKVATEALCEYIVHHDDSKKELKALDDSLKKNKFHRSHRLYKSNLRQKDLQQVRRMAGSMYYGAGGAPALPAEIEQLFDGAGSTPQAALQRLGALLKEQTGSEEVAAFVDGLKLEELDAKVETARRKKLRSTDDVVEFFKPMLDELRLRNQLVMTSGSEVGVGIPLLPWVPVSPATVSANINAWSRKREAQFQLKSPTYGVEFVISDIATTSHDIKASGGLGWTDGPLKATAPYGSGKLERSKAEASFTVLRILREKNEHSVRDETKAREEGLAVLNTLLKWRAGDLQQAADIAGPLDAILARHPAVIIGWGNKENVSLQGSLDVGAMARVTPGGNVSFGVTTGLSGKMERAQERSDEHTGYAHQTVHDRSDQRKQRITLGGSLGVLGSYKQALQVDEKGHADGKGSWAAGGAVNALELSRDLLVRLEKNGATRFNIGDQTGGSTDRVFLSAGMLLAEIEENREEFYLRFLDTVPGPKGEEKDTPENRQLAETTLNQFIADLKGSKKNHNLQFNLKYEMQPRMSGWVDALRALESLERRGGNHAEAAEYQRTLHDLMQQRSTWAFKNCAIRSKGKDSADLGWDWLIRLMAKRTAETSVAVTAYPA